MADIEQMTEAHFDEVLQSSPDLLNSIPDQSPEDASLSQAIKLMNDDERNQIASSMYVAKDENPDQYAKARQMAERLNLPPAIVARNYDEFVKREKTEFAEYDDLIKRNPKVAEFLQDADNARIAHDDIDGMKKAEEAVRDVKWSYALHDLLQVGFAKMNQAIGGAPAFAYDLAMTPGNWIAKTAGHPEMQVESPEWLRENALVKFGREQEQAFMGELHPDFKAMPTEVFMSDIWNPKDGTPKVDRLARNILGHVVMNAPNMMSMIAAGPGAGLAFAGISSASEKNLEAHAGQWMDVEDPSQPAQLVDGHMVPATKRVFVKADPASATLGAALNGAIEASFEKIGTFGLLHKWEGAIASQFNKQLSRETMKVIGKQMAVSMLGEANEEALTSFAQDFSDYVSGINPNAMKGSIQRMIDAGAIGAASGGTMTSGFGVAPLLYSRARTIEQVNRTHGDFIELEKVATDLKIHGRLPEASSRFLDSIAQGTPLENVRIKSDKFSEYFQKKGMNPVDVAESLGILKQYAVAKETGDDVKIPFGKFAQHFAGTEHYKGLSQDIRFEAQIDAMSVNESKELTEEMKVESENAKKAAAGAEAVERNIFNQLKQTQQYSNKQARIMAQFMRQRYEARASRIGDQAAALELFKTTGLKIQYQETDTGEPGLYQKQAAPEVNPNVSELGFYSGLEFEVQKMNFKDMPANDLLGRLNNLQGLKQEELDFTGIKEWLDSRAKAQPTFGVYADGNLLGSYDTLEMANAQKDEYWSGSPAHQGMNLEVKEIPPNKKVTKDEVLQFITDNGVKLEQSVAGENYQAPGKEKRSDNSRRSADGLVRADDVEWTEENMDARDIDPDGTLRSENAYERAREDWRYNRDEEWVKEKADEIEKEVREDNPEWDDAQVLDKVEDLYIERMSDVYYEQETEDIDNGNSIYSKLKIYPSNVSTDIYIEYWPESGSEAELHDTNSRRTITGDVPELKARALEIMADNGEISNAPRSDMHANQIQWQTHGEDTTATITFENGDDGEIEINFTEGSGYDVYFKGVINSYVADLRPTYDTLQEAKDAAIEALINEDLLLPAQEPQAGEQLALPEAQPEEPKKDVNKLTGKTRFSQYSLEGGTNNREFKLILPPTVNRKTGEMRKDFTEGHFEPNVVVHARATDRETLKGEKVFFIEEQQSDWHQKGRKRGYLTAPLTQEQKDLFKKLKEQISQEKDKLEETRKQEVQDAIEKNQAKFDEKNAEFLSKIAGYEKQNEELKAELQPHKDRSTELALKLNEARAVHNNIQTEAEDSYEPVFKTIDERIENSTAKRNIKNIIAQEVRNDGSIDFAAVADKSWANTNESLSWGYNDEDRAKIKAEIDKLFKSKTFQKKINAAIPFVLKERVQAHEADKIAEQLSASRDAEEKIKDRIRINENYIDNFEREIPSIDEWVTKQFLVDRTKSREENAALQKTRDEAAKVDEKNMLPDAPWKQSSVWMGLAFKRMLSVAVAENKDIIAWSIGQVHVERYSALRYLKSATYYIDKDGDYKVSGVTVDGSNFYPQTIKEEDLVQTIGKDLAEKMMAGEGEQTEDGRVITGENLKAGDEGHITLYDTILKKTVDAIIKKLDKNAKIELMDATEAFGKPLTEGESKFDKFWAVRITPEMKAKIEKGQTLFQKQDGVAQGKTTFLDNQTIMTLFKAKDLSTFLHESGHIFLEELIADATSVLATDQLKADMDKVLEWFGVDARVADGFEAIKKAIEVKHHEKFADGWLTYLREGKAPVRALQKIFTQFSAWLRNVFPIAVNADVQLTDDIRDVMSRLIAIDQAVKAVSPDLLAIDPVALKMSKAETKSYLQAMQDARIAIEEHVASKIMAEYDREKEKWYKEESAKVELEVRGELATDKTYLAINAIKGGAAQKIDRKSFVAKFGKDAAAKMPKGTLAAKDGAHYSVVSELVGYDNANTFVTDMLEKPAFEAAVKDETKRRMDAKHPSILVNGMLPELAVEAYHNDNQAELMRFQLDFLAKYELPTLKNLIRKVARRVPSEQEMKQSAEKIVGDETVGLLFGSIGPAEDGQPSRTPKLATQYYRNEVRAANEAGKLLAKGNIDKALESKRMELLSHELYKQAVAAAREVEKSIEKFKPILKKSDEKLAKSRDINYVNAARAVLAAYGFGEVEKAPLEYLRQLEQYDPDTYAGVALMVADALKNAKPWRTATVDEFRQMSAIVETMWDLAKERKSIEIDGKKLDQAEVQAELEAQAASHPGKARLGENKSGLETKDEIIGALIGTRAALRRVESWARLIDKGEAGPFTRYFIQPVMDAVSRFKLEKKSTLEKYAAIIEPISKSLSDGPIIAKELGGFTFLNKGHLIGALLHTGNAGANSNLEKLLVGYGWGTLNDDGVLDTSRWDRFVLEMERTGVITEADWKAVQAIWDLNESMKPAAQRAHKRILGYWFKEITATPFKTSLGEHRGGYMPAFADKTKTDKAAAQDEKAIFENNVASFMFPTTGRGSTMERVKYYAPLELDLMAVPRHIDKTLRFIHIEPTVREIARIVMNKDFQKTIGNYDQVAIRKLLIPWLQRTAQQRVEMPIADESFWKGFEPTLKFLRQRSALMTMTWNLSQVLQNFASVFPAMVRVDMRNMAQGIYASTFSPKITTKEISEKSPFMRTELEKSVVEVTGEVENLISNPSMFRNIQETSKKAGYFFQKLTQDLVTKAAWIGAYNQAIEEGKSEVQAVRFADSVVRETQAAFGAESVSSMEASNAGARLFTMYAGYFNTQANLIATEMALAKNKQGMERVNRAVFVYLMAIAAPAIASQMIAQALKGKLDDDDDGKYLDDIFALIFGSQFKYLTAMTPVVGPSINALTNTVVTKKVFDDKLNLSPVVNTVESTAKAVAGKGNAKDVFTAIGLVTGLPTGIIARPMTYIEKVNKGKARPANQLDQMRGLMTGQ